MCAPLTSTPRSIASRAVRRVRPMLFLMALVPPLAFTAVYAESGPAAVSISEHSGRRPLFPAMEVLEDDSGNLPLEKITTTAMSARFVKLQGSPPNIGYSSSVFWVRFHINNESKAALRWMLQLSQPWTKRVELFIPEGNGYRSLTAGTGLPFGERPVYYRNFIFPVTQPPGVARYLMRIDPGINSLSLGLYAWDPASLQRFIAHEMSVHWILAGLLAAMVIYSLLLWGSIRDRTYLLNAAFIGTLGLYMLDFHGLAFQFLWPESSWWKTISLQVLSSLTYVAGITFFRHYLLLKEFLPGLSNALTVLAALHVARILFKTAGLPLPRDIWFIYLNMIVLLLLIYGGIKTALKGYRPARFFLIGTGLLLIAAVTTNLRVFGLISDNFITLWGVEFAAAMLVILVSMGLADSINAIRNELVHSQDDLLMLNRRLDEERERLSVTLRSIGDGVITTDLDGRVVMMNRAAEKITETPQTEAFGKPVEMVLRLDGPEGFPLNMPAACADGAEYSCESIGKGNLLSSNRGGRIIEYGTSPVTDRESRVIGTVLAFRDITERQMLEEEMLRSSRIESLGVLAGGIAHDFNNVLTVILGNITLAKMITPESERVYRILSEAEAASYRARNLTQQLLTFSRGGEPIRSTVDPGKLLVETVNFVLTGSQVRAEFMVRDDLSLIEADEGQLAQVINNVVINAMQAMPDGGTIRVCAKNRQVSAGEGIPLEPGPYVMISIADEGGGIPEENLKKVFDPYFTTKSYGTGLGLASSFNIVRRHGGYISAVSRTGGGAEIVFYLPSAMGSSVKMEQSSRNIIRGRGRILIMDDDEHILDIGVRLLNELGYSTDIAVNGDIAVEMYRRALESGEVFDAVIMDLTIQGGAGGRVTIKRLLEIDPDVKAIVSSGYSNDPIMADYREYGFHGVVVKPYRVEELSSVLHRVLSGRVENGADA